MFYEKNRSPELEKSLFENPTAEYRGTPFWAWNCHLTKEELLRQLDVLREMGFGGAHMHVRTGMDTPYLSEEFFDLVSACVEKAKSEKMLAWLYDEDRWPSGAAGGIVTKDERYRQRYLLFTHSSYEEKAGNDDLVSSCADAVRTGRGKLLARFDVKLNGEGGLVSYRRLAEGEGGDNIWYAYLEQPSESPWFNNQTYLNTLDPKAIARFIEVTHEGYRKHIAGEFGKTVPAIFTDEPQFTRKNTLPFATVDADVTLPFTDDLDETFSARYGVSLLDSLPELIWEKESGVSRIRYLYHDHVADRFAEAFADQIGAWCEKNGIMLTGHMMAEDTLGSQTGALGEAMRSYRSFQLPGIDMLCAGFNFNTAKQTQSAVHQYGREGMLSELYGVTGWDFDFRGHKLHGDWQAALGVTVRVPHLSWVSMKGEAKRDYPASINYQSPWYREYRYVEDHFARVNTAITRGKPLVKVGVIHPVESYWLHWGPSEQTALIRQKMDEHFSSLTDWLLFGTVDFDFIAESLLPSLCPAAGNPLPVGEMQYDTILVPECETLRSSTLERLESFRAAGGNLIFLGDAPTLCDAIPSERGRKLWEGSRRIPFDRSSVLSALSDVREVELRAANGNLTTRLITQMREEATCRWLFVCNAREPYNKDVSSHTDVTVKLKGRFVPTLYNTLEGSISPLPYTIRDGYTYVNRRFYDYDSLLLKLEPAKEGDSGVAAVKAPAGTSEEKSVPTAVSYRNGEPNALLLDKAEYALDFGDFRGPEEVLRVDTTLRRELGWIKKEAGAASLGSPAQPWVLPPEIPSHTVTFRYEIESEIELDSLWLALEDYDKATVVWNGKPIDRPADGYYVDLAIGKIPLPGLKAGKNILTVTIPYAKRVFLEWCYLLGEFGVRVMGERKVIVAKPKTVGFDDLVRQGFPFFGGRFDYEIPFTSKGGEISLRVPHYRGAVIAVSLDGRKIGNLAYPPYSIGLGRVAAGAHTLTVSLFVSRQNAFGSLHNADRAHSWEGPDAWRTVGDRWTDSYRLTEEGVLSAPVLTEKI